jgi:4-amino-4-deoxy-L-arabinose transferase-like glycosyltransferase
MWILKGTLFWLWLMGFGTIALLYFTIYRNLPPSVGTSRVDIRVFAINTIQNPLWWVALVACFVLSYAITHSCSGSPTLWVALLVTGLVPAGLLALFIAMAVKLKQASQSHA